jgi:hypothetical protein
MFRIWKEDPGGDKSTGSRSGKSRVVDPDKSGFNNFVDPDPGWESGSGIRIQGQENEEK